ncbi:MotA/TolQ/ExbB proton channel family protein [Candidatus Uabimicrobium amorphum]|uniref:TolQ protein n=1 Tax=Uabimicrobium amorphum TaxID=2596890 RepID=A0A5S9F2X6_UABAM|nr:MotA/TolQ/ExbB proton channel family protein [Candidatus Uabimicrobium amorphum]BBM83671.1 tolQ protein [Candidatus Uabimicrobium amorphum]
MSSKKLLWTTILLIMSLFCASSLLIAQDDAGIEGEFQDDYTLWGLIKVSGPIGWLIILLSVATLALAIEHLVSLRRDKLIPPDLLQEIEDLFEEEAYEEVMETCAAEPGYFTNVIGAALPRVNSGYDSMMEAVHSISEEESVKLQQKISWMQLISAVAPMLGLLGTVTGMIGAFSQIATMSGAPKPKDLAKGIYQALVTTCLGLIVAIPAIACYFYFRNKVVRISMEINGISEELLERFRQDA